MANYYNEIEEKAKAVEYLNMGDKEFRLKDKKAIELKKEIVQGAIPIVEGIINTHKYYKFESFEDCLTEGLIACHEALERFDPNYVSKYTGVVKLFNYFSLTARRAILYYTIGNKNHRMNDDMEYASLILESPDYHDPESLNHVDDLIETLWNTLGQDRKYIKIIPIFEKYLRSVGGMYNKREFYKFGDKYNISKNRLRLFLKAMSNNKEEIKSRVL